MMNCKTDKNNRFLKKEVVGVLKQNTKAKIFTTTETVTLTGLV